MKKHFFAASILIVAFAGATLFSRHDDRKDTFQAIHLKMTKSEVRHLLGGPSAVPDKTRRTEWGGTEELWLGRDGTILVAFKDDVLTYKEWIEPEAMIYVSGFSE